MDPQVRICYAKCSSYSGMWKLFGLDNQREEVKTQEKQMKRGAKQTNK